MSGKQPKGGGSNPPPAGSGSGLGGASARQRQLLAQAAELEAREKAGQVRQTSSGKPDPTGARSLYAPSTPGSKAPSPGNSVPPTPTTRASSLPAVPGSAESADMGGYASSEGGATPMATEEDRTLAQQGGENPFVMNNPYPAVFMGATRELR